MYLSVRSQPPQDLTLVIVESITEAREGKEPTWNGESGALRRRAEKINRLITSKMMICQGEGIDGGTGLD